MNEKRVNIPIFIPHKGCAHDCIYCNQKSISGQIDEMTESKMRGIIEEHFKTLKDKINVELGFFGGSFTGIPREEQIKFLKIANEYISDDKISSIRLSTRPDYINEEILEYLGKYNVKTIELGVQSLDPEVLKRSSRGHNPEIVYRASELIKKHGFNLGIQTMVGLPGDSREKDIYTANQVINISPSFVRIYPTLVIKGTYLEEQLEKGDYRPLTLKQAVDICAVLLKLYEENNIKVIRLGLQPTDSINSGMDVIGGPFHPAFRQLVQSKLVLSEIEEHFTLKGLPDMKEITIYTGSGNISNVIGQKRGNILFLKEKYGFRKITILEKNGLKNKLEIKF